MLLSSVSLLFVFQTETPPKTKMMKIAASLAIAVICATLFVATDAANDGYSGNYMTTQNSFIDPLSRAT